jgi:hypothetical protein
VKRFLFVFVFLFTAALCKSQKTMMFKEEPMYKPAIDNEVVLEWNTKQPGYNGLSDVEKQFYYWVNYSRLDPLAFFDSIVVPFVKSYPQLNGKNYSSLKIEMENAGHLPLFALNSQLLKMAAYHASDITRNNASPSHNSHNGETFDDRFRKNGLSKCGGENISYGSGDTDPLFMLVLLYLDINVDDLGHRKALLNPSYINTGISLANYANGNAFLVEDFACRQE